MTDLQKHIDEAFKLIGAIAVTGENQDKAVMAKEHLRAAYKLAEEAHDGGQDDR